MAEPKKETVRIALPPRPEQAGSAPGIEKRDTARIVLPSRTPITPIRRPPPTITPLPASESATDAPNILPRRPPVTPPTAPASSPLLQPLPKPPGAESNAGPGAAVRPVPPAREENGMSALSVNRGPKKETARISVLPRPVSTAAPTINMTKTQPLLIQPAGTTPVAPVVITSKPLAPVDAIPRSLALGLLGISAVIFLIQIWNYVVS
jgi:hypothetical protein